MKRVVALLSFFLCAAGCADMAWYMKQGKGQLEILTSARPVSEVLKRDDLDPKMRRRIIMAQAAARFAKHEMGLNVKAQYRSMIFVDRDAMAYVVSASPKTDLKPYRWDYPIVGSLPYRGFLERADAEKLAEELAAEDWDVHVRGAPTYSLLGILPDPLVSPMLEGSDDAWIIETVIHELAHATVFASGAGAFNEGMATFIGKEGRRLFLKKYYGENAIIYREAQDYDSDREVYARAVGALAFDLRIMFAQSYDRPREEILKEKAETFRHHKKRFRESVERIMKTKRLVGATLPSNNAQISAYGIYTLQQHLYRRTYDACGKQMACFLRVMRQAADEKNPESSLALRLLERGPTERVVP